MKIGTIVRHIQGGGLFIAGATQVEQGSAYRLIGLYNLTTGHCYTGHVVSTVEDQQPFDETTIHVITGGHPDWFEELPVRGDGAIIFANNRNNIKDDGQDKGQ